MVPTPPPHPNTPDATAEDLDVEQTSWAEEGPRWHFIHLAVNKHCFASLIPWRNVDRSEVRGHNITLKYRAWRPSYKCLWCNTFILICGSICTAQIHYQQLQSPELSFLLLSMNFEKKVVPLSLSSFHLQGNRTGKVQNHTGTCWQYKRWTSGSQGSSPLFSPLGCPSAGSRSHSASSPRGLASEKLSADLSRS